MLSITSRPLFSTFNALKHLTIRNMGTVYPTTKSTATELLSILPRKFETAKSSGELFFFPSTSRDIHSEGRRVGATGSPSVQGANQSLISAHALRCSISRKRKRKLWQLRPKPLHLMLNDHEESRMMERVGNRMPRNRSNRLMLRSYMWEH